MLYLPLKLPLLLRFLNGRSSKLPLWGILTDGRSLPMLFFVLWNCFIYVGVLFVCECLVKRAVNAKLGQFFPGQSLRRLGTDFALYLWVKRVSRRAFSVVFLVIKLFDILNFIPLLMIAFNIKRSYVLKKGRKENRKKCK